MSLVFITQVYHDAWSTECESSTVFQQTH